VLRDIGEAAPEVDLFYSIDVRPKLDLFHSVAARDTRPTGVSCKHTLLTEPLIRMLHEQGFLVVAWTVDDADRAMALARWGVDGITTNVVPYPRPLLRAADMTPISIYIHIPFCTIKCGYCDFNAYAGMGDCKTRTSRRC
jgi:hypothetical protein